MPRRSRPSRPGLRAVLALVLLSGIILLLPQGYGRSFANLLQLLVPFQHLLSRATPAGSTGAEPIGPEAHARLQNTLRRYENRLAVMQTRITDLEIVNSDLAGLRSLGLRDGRLIPARILATDSLPWRGSRLIDQGALTGVQERAPVTSSLVLSAGEEADLSQGMSILAGEVLIAEVGQVLTHSSRVVLLTDPKSGSRLVRIGRSDAGSFTCIPTEFVLHGIGGNRMEVRGVSHEYIDSRQVLPGHTVLASATDDQLPIPLVIGQVSEIRRDDDNAVLYNLIVQPALDPTALQRVYVVALKP